MPSILDPLIERISRRYVWQKTEAGPRRLQNESLTDAHLNRHLTGRAVYGVCPISPGESTVRCAVLDLDSHKGETSWADMRLAAQAIRYELIAQGLIPNAFRSSGGRGIHLILLWDIPQSASAVRHTLRDVLAAAGFTVGTQGVAAKAVEIFPKQSKLADDGYGSMFILPFGGRSHALDSTDFSDIPADRLSWAISTPVPAFEVDTPSTSTQVPASLYEVQRALDCIPNSGVFSLDYDDWLHIVMAIHTVAPGSDGLAVAEAFGAKSEKDVAGYLADRVWPYLDETKEQIITVATLFAKAREYGYTDASIEDYVDLDTEQPESPASDVPRETAGPNPRFRVWAPTELLDLPYPEYLVDGLLPECSLAMIYGASGSGKSFLSLDLALSLARGSRWRDLDTEQRRVVYIAAEGQMGFRQRLAAYYAAHDVAPAALTGQFGLITDAPNLGHKDGDAAQLYRQLQPHKPQILVIDTLAQVSPGSDENSAEAMGVVLLNCRKLHRATGAMIVLIHHAGKDASKGARGWSGIRAAVDVEIEVSRPDDQLPGRFAKLTKSKEGLDGVLMPFSLGTVVVGHTPKGREVSSCVVQHEAPGSAPPARREPSGKVQRILWRILHAGVELGLDGVDEAEMLPQLVGALPTDRDARGQDRRRDTVKRGLQSLIEGGYMAKRNGKLFVSAPE